MCVHTYLRNLYIQFFFPKLHFQHVHCRNAEQGRLLKGTSTIYIRGGLGRPSFSFHCMGSIFQ